MKPRPHRYRAVPFQVKEGDPNAGLERNNLYGVEAIGATPWRRRKKSAALSARLMNASTMPRLVQRIT
jgi:hypothetical protein